MLVNNKFRPSTIDRFTDNKNAKLERFNSKYYCPGTLSVNAFTTDWSEENNWLCPPIAHIGSVLKYMKLCRAQGTLFVPIWPLSYFWPLLYSNGKQLENFIEEFLIVKPFFTKLRFFRIYMF